MQWLGKAVGGLLGAFGGPVGSLIGVLIGHQWDQTVGAGRGQRSVQAISRLFFEVAFEVMGAIAKVDGRVSEDEIRIARRIMAMAADRHRRRQGLPARVRGRQ